MFLQKPHFLNVAFFVFSYLKPEVDRRHSAALSLINNFKMLSYDSCIFNARQAPCFQKRRINIRMNSSPVFQT